MTKHEDAEFLVTENAEKRRFFATFGEKIRVR